jgi:hypothetical protein
MPRFTLKNEPSNVHVHTLTDKELVIHAEHVFPDPGPLISELIKRLSKRYPGPAEQLPHGDGRHERDDACPACGTPLEVVASI